MGSPPHSSTHLTIIDQQTVSSHLSNPELELQVSIVLSTLSSVSIISEPGGGGGVIR